MKKLLYILLLFSGLLSSCNNLLEIESERRANYLNYWKTEQDAESAVKGLHATFRSTFGHWVMQARDRRVQFDYPGTIWEDAINNNLAYAYGRDSRELSWSYEYKLVSQASFIIENIYRADLPEERENFYKGQALVIRAFTYLYNIQTWGNIPLVRESQDVSEKGRTDWNTVLDFVISDLKQAIQILPTADALKDANGTTLVSKQYISQGTANALLAWAYGWKAGFGQQPDYYAEVIRYATEVINDANYLLAANPELVCTSVLKGNSAEGILELDYLSNPDEYKSYGSYIAGACQRYPIQPGTTAATKRSPRIFNTTVYAMYSDKTDLRRNAYFFKLDSMATYPSNQASAYIQKWRFAETWKEGITAGKMKTYKQNEILIRLPDIILRRAEAYAKTGQTDKAITDLNTIRRRANASDYSAAEGNLSEAIQLERDRELYMEGICIHFFDLLRNHSYQNLLGEFKNLSEQDIEDGALFLPAAQSAFNRNAPLKQSPYWKKHGFN